MLDYFSTYSPLTSIFWPVNWQFLNASIVKNSGLNTMYINKILLNEIKPLCFCVKLIKKLVQKVHFSALRSYPGRHFKKRRSDDWHSIFATWL